MKEPCRLELDETRQMYHTLPISTADAVETYGLLQASDKYFAEDNNASAQKRRGYVWGVAAD